MVETLQQNGINLLTLTNQSVDGLEALITSLGSNTDTLEALINTMTGRVDALEPLLADIKALATTDATKQDAQKAVLDALATALTDLKTLATVDATKQDGHQATLTAISNKLPALGQAEMAESLPVTLASDQAALPVTSPTLLAKLEEIRVIDAADATKQDAHTTALNAINTKMPTLGQKAMAASQPVVLASDQAAIPVTSPTLLAKEEEIRVQVAALNTKTPTLGQKAAVASQPVVLASDQPAITVAHAPVTRTPTVTNATAAGTVAAGAVQVSILNTGTTAATVAGGQLLPGASITWSPPKGETLAAINYTASATATLAISRLA
jgi:hypothetical protein